MNIVIVRILGVVYNVFMLYFSVNGKINELNQSHNTLENKWNTGSGVKIV